MTDCPDEESFEMDLAINAPDLQTARDRALFRLSRISWSRRQRLSSGGWRACPSGRRSPAHP